ncbi:MAG: hypothetical protein KIS76_15655 [Pyrinomonadaceae bacterium]|nr:hypothetical protein [Pyrinomonadaceae bacterium]
MNITTDQNAVNLKINVNILIGASDAPFYYPAVIFLKDDPPALTVGTSSREAIDSSSQS